MECNKNKTRTRWTLAAILGLMFGLSTIGVARAEPVCAEVKIEIQQELTLERQAFDAMMRINNGLDTIAIENVQVDVHFQDEDGNGVLATTDPNSTDPDVKFFIRIDSMDGISDVSGSGSVAPGSTGEIHWLIIPVPGSADGVPSGKLYFVGATLSYTVGGEPETVEVTPDFITVKPLPQLALDYFLTRQVVGDDAFTAAVEPPEPYTLGVRINNKGTGPATDVKIDSAQPKIVENDQGLLIGFQITGSSVNDQPAAPTLLIDFGDIEPGASTVGRWIMETTLAGEFTEFTASVSHSDDLGGQVTSIIDSNDINTHFLVQDVLVDLPGRDGVRDFLAHATNSDLQALHVYESDTVDTEVENLSGSASFPVVGQSGNFVDHALNIPATTGFVYARLPDPYGGTKTVASAVRSDGKSVSLNNAWTSKTRNHDGPEPTWDYWINLFDANTTGAYTIRMGDLVSGPVAPVMQFIPDRVTHETRQVGFLVEASDANQEIPSLSAAPLPAGATFIDNNDGSAYFNWTPAEGQAGVYDIVFRASDGLHETTRTATIQVNPLWDTDGDGMDDEWELQHFGSLDRDGTGDFDGDGISDLQEYLSGTDPTIPDGPGLPRVVTPMISGEVVTQRPELVFENSVHGDQDTVTYQLEVYEDAGFTQQVAAVDQLEETPDTTSWTVDVDLADNRWHYWRVRAHDGQTYSAWVEGDFFVNTANDAPGPFRISYPDDGGTVTTALPTLVVTNSLDVDEDALAYGFEVFSDDQLSMLVASANGIEPGDYGATGWTVDQPLSDNTNYYWRATVVDEHGMMTEGPVGSFLVNQANEAPQAPTVDAPAVDSEVAGPDVTLQVANASDAEGDSLVYYFELDTVNTFDSAGKQASDAVVETTETTGWAVSGLSENTEHFWRARAFDGTSFSPWVQGRFFVNSGNDAPSMPALRNPGDQAWVDILTPTLEVYPSTDPDGDAVEYRFQLYSDPDLTTLLYESVGPETAWTPVNQLSDNTWYHWRVRAEDSAGANSPWSAGSSFFVNDNGLDDAPMITLIEPVADQEPSADTVTLRWDDQDPDSNASVALYYDLNDTGFDGTLITGDIGEDSDGDDDTYLWNTSALPEGTYYVYAEISDDTTVERVYATGAVIIPSSDANQPPVAVDDEATSLDGMPVTIAVLANDTDADSDPLTIASFTQPANGAVQASGTDALTYTPASGYFGSDAFTYTVSDGNGGSATGNVTLTVTASDNVAPTVTITTPGDGADFPAGQDVTFTATAEDPEDGDIGDSIAWSSSLDGALGTGASVVASGLGVGTHTITASVTDLNGASDEASIVIDVLGGTAGSTIVGTAGHDTLTGTAGDDVILGQAGNDTMYGMDGNDAFVVDGTDNGSDIFNGGAGADTVHGGSGDDIFRVRDFSGENTVEVIDGGSGTDTLSGHGYNTVLDLGGTTLLNVERIFGGGGKDTIIGTTGNDLIEGGVGDDILRGEGGDDTFLVEGDNNGRDIFNGGAGTDTLQGGSGDDTFHVQDFSGENTVEVIDGGEGTNVLSANGFSATLDLSDTTLLGVERIFGGGGSDTIIGTDGNDVIEGGLGNDVLRGEAGDDVFVVEGSSYGRDIFNGGDGNDLLQGGSGDDVFHVQQFSGANRVETIDGGGGNDILSASGTNATVDLSGVTLLGIEKILGGGGKDTIIGSAGNDVIEGGFGDDVLRGEDGDDVFVVTGSDNGRDIISGGNGIDTLQGSSGDDTFHVQDFSGENTVEVIDGSDGNDVLSAHGFNATLDLSGVTLLSIEKIFGGDGSDTIIGTANNDVIEGGLGKDTLRGEGGDDVFIVEGTANNNDVLDGGDGNDTVLGGSGDDIFQVQSVSSIENFDGGAGYDVLSANGYNATLDLGNSTLLNLERIFGGGGNDTITGSAGNDVIEGGIGNDTLYGGAGDDVFVVEGTGNGRDVFSGGAGTDVLQGSDSDDIFHVRQFNGAYSVEKIDAGAGTDILSGDGYNATMDLSATSVVSLERIVGGGGNDTIIGSSANDVIEGGTGNDVLYGEGGDDVFVVEGTGNGGDVVNGGSGTDILQGGAGDDTFRVQHFGGDNSVEQIDGGGGNDVLSGHGYNATLDLSDTTAVSLERILGGGGNDSIIGSSGDDVIEGGDGNDTLQGGLGNDVYAFGRGDRRDTVYSLNSDDAQEFDEVRFLSDISANQLWMERVGDDLRILIIGTTDSITIRNWYSGTVNRVDVFSTADGSLLLASQVDDLVSVMADYEPPLLGQTDLPAELQATIGSLIADTWHHGVDGSPIVVTPADRTTEATDQETEVALGVATAFDRQDGYVAATADNPGPFALGSNTVTWVAVDSDGNTGTAVQMVTVEDTTPPELTVPSNVLVTTSSNDAISVDIGSASASDIFDPVTIGNDAPDAFPEGNTLVTWTATDANGNSTSRRQLVSVAGPNTSYRQEFSVERVTGPSLLNGPIDEVTVVDGMAFFVAEDSASGRELWVSDGTSAGTVVLKDILAGPTSSNPSALTPIGNELYFLVDDGYDARELWRTDGTTAGTIMVESAPADGQHIVQFLGEPHVTSYPAFVAGDAMYHVAEDSSNGIELWKNEGSGDVVVRDINPGTANSAPGELTVVGETLYFVAADGTHGRELWKTDGTTDGTVLVHDINPGVAGSTPNDLQVLDSTLYFAADDGDAGRELWKSDGTQSGTQLVEDLWSGADSSSPEDLVAVGSRLYFSATDGATGIEPWRLDTGAENPEQVRDIHAGVTSSDPRQLLAASEGTYFAANDGVHGLELWHSNGDSEQTRLVVDVNPGPEGSTPILTQTGVDTAGGRLFHVADDGVNGQQLWLVREISTPFIDDDGDGMDDIWEFENFGDFNAIASGDPDADGWSNLEEFEADTDPNDSASY